MSNASVNAELVIRFRDASGPGAAAAVRTAEQTAQKVGSASTRASQTAAEAAERGGQRQRTAAERLATAREALGIRAERVIQREIQVTEAAYNRLAKAGFNSAEEQTRAYEKTRLKIQQLTNEMGRLTSAQQKAANESSAIERGQKAAAAMAGIAGGYRVGRTILGRYADLEQAQTELRISMTDRRGGVSSQYDRTLAVAERLGNLLPGTTRDFVLEAQALKQKGIADSTIANGGLEAAGLLRVGMGMRGEGEAGELVAKTMHSFGLKDNELVGAADHTFRLYKAYGTKARDITEANTYMGGTLNQLGWTGADNMRKVQAMQGMLASKGLESSVFGTNFADMLSFVARNETRLKGKGAETKEVNAILGAHGIKLDLFDKKGKFVDPDEFMRQMQKLQALTQKEMIEVFHKLFGTQGERVATELVRSGPQGVKEAEDKVDNIVSLTEAVKQQTETFAGKAEALSGSFDNMLASMGKPIGDALKPVMEKLNDAVGGATDFFKEHPATAGIATVGAVGVGGLATWTLLGTLLSGVGVPVRVVGGAGLPGIPGALESGVPAGAVAGSGAAGASRWALARSFGLATAPLAAMAYVTDWAGDTSHDVERAESSLSFSKSLNQVLSLFGLDKQAEFDRRRAEMRAELEVTVKDDRVDVTRSRVDGNGVSARMTAGPSSPTGNIMKGAPQ